MKNRLLACGLALSMSFTAANQSRANDMANILIGVVGAVVVGAVIANVVAKLDEDAKRQRDAAVASARRRPAGSSTSWKGKDGTSGKVKIAKVERMPDGKVCREVQETITFQGKPSTETRNECA